MDQLPRSLSMQVKQSTVQWKIYSLMLCVLHTQVCIVRVRIGSDVTYKNKLQLNTKPYYVISGVIGNRNAHYYTKIITKQLTHVSSVTANYTFF